MKKILIAGMAGILALSGILLSCMSKYSPGKAASSYGSGYLSRSASQDMLFQLELEQMELDIEEFDPSNFDHIVDNSFRRVEQYPLSTFSVDVDTAGYSMARRFIEGKRLPPKSAIRIEELINYFDYNYPPPHDGKPFATYIETAAAPWNSKHLLTRIALKGKEFPVSERPRVNLVFLIDVSGSMSPPNRLPLVKDSLKMLVNELNGADRVGICVYAGAAGTVLPPTSCDNKNAIIRSLNKLSSGGSTAGGEGIRLAYNMAEENFDPQAVNRVILCTDGDFNVGITNRGDLINLVTEKAKTGVYLTVLGFGMDNFQDGMLKQLSSKGNGNYGYIDTIEEAKKILVKQLSGTLVTIAQDVKIQVEFNPATVGAYRLIGYENRVMRDEDFNDDSADAGDIGAGHTVTAFYEIIPVGSPELADLPVRDDLKYQPAPAYQPTFKEEFLTVKIRYKLPNHNESSLLSIPVGVEVQKTGTETEDFRFAASVAGFGMLLRDSPYKGSITYADVVKLAQGALGRDEFDYRKNFVEMVKKAGSIK
jgi:Ca-activated chloride channel family protein